jgi:hypothetical protein
VTDIKQGNVTNSLINLVNEAQPHQASYIQPMDHPESASDDDCIEKVCENTFNVKNSKPNIFPQRRSNKNMSYEQQILRSLREVMSEGELIKIKTQILEDIKKYE